MPAFVATIVGDIVSTTVAFLTTAIGTYWIYMLGASLVIGLGYLFLRLAHLGTGKR